MILPLLCIVISLSGPLSRQERKVNMRTRGTIMPGVNRCLYETCGRERATIKVHQGEENRFWSRNKCVADINPIPKPRLIGVKDSGDIAKMYEQFVL